MKIDATKRMILKYLGVASIPLILFLSMRSTLKYKIFGRIKDTLKPIRNIPAYRQRRIADLPSGGLSTSVESALNSRCTSDYDDDQKIFHWGRFIRDARISDDNLSKIVELSHVRQLTDRRTGILVEDNLLTFTIDGLAKNGDRDRLMIESGMQQQAVGLICAALGIGMLFKNLTMDGKELNSQEYGTVSVYIGPTKPGYGNSYWTDQAPKDWKPWRNGNLPAPSRRGSNHLIALIADLGYRCEGKRIANFDDVAQLLWAARGRTPHLYKSKPWSLTIPFWTDKIDVSSILLIADHCCYQYVNWKKNHPTHSIKKERDLAVEQMKHLSNEFPAMKYAVLIRRNDNHARAFWEIGYEALNIILQATALEISYNLVFPNDNQKKILEQYGMDEIEVVISIS